MTNKVPSINGHIHDKKDANLIIDGMWADIFLNEYDETWSVIIGSHYDDGCITLFSKCDYKSDKTAEIGMESAWTRIKNKLIKSSQ